MQKSKLLLAVVAMTIGFSSCGNSKEHCYEIVVSVSMMGMSQAATSYAWTTEDEIYIAVEQVKQDFQDVTGIQDGISTSYKKTAKSKSNCH